MFHIARRRSQCVGPFLGDQEQQDQEPTWWLLAGPLGQLTEVQPPPEVWAAWYCVMSGARQT